MVSGDRCTGLTTAGGDRRRGGDRSTRAAGDGREGLTLRNMRTCNTQRCAIQNAVNNLNGVSCRTTGNPKMVLSYLLALSFPWIRSSIINCVVLQSSVHGTCL